MSETARDGKTGLEETDLIRRARRGDPAAWEALIRLHQEAVFRYALWLVGEPDEAEDVAQETFIRMLRSLDRFDVSRPLRPWLIRIARNLARNRWRGARRALAAVERWRVDRELRSDPRGGRGDPSWQGPGPALRAVLGRLSEPDRQVIILRYLLELPLDETCRVLGVPAGTVKSRSSRALARLRTLVEQAGPELREALEP